jgi:hypothetical protein
MAAMADDDDDGGSFLASCNAHKTQACGLFWLAAE